MSKHKDLSLATIESIAANACFMDNFVVVGSKNKSVAPSPSALVATNKKGKEFCSPWEWLVTYNLAAVVSWWHHSLKAGFYCVFCNSSGKHHSLKCPLLGDMGLKIIEVRGQGDGTMPGLSLGGPPASDASGGASLLLLSLQRLHLLRLCPCLLQHLVLLLLLWV